MKKIFVLAVFMICISLPSLALASWKTICLYNGASLSPTADHRVIYERVGALLRTAGVFPEQYSAQQIKSYIDKGQGELLYISAANGAGKNPEAATKLCSKYFDK